MTVPSSSSSPSLGRAALLSLVGALASLGAFLSLAEEQSAPALRTPAAPPVPASLTTAPSAVPTAAASVQQDGSAAGPLHDEVSGFIVDDGWELVASQCTACHSAKLVTQNRGDEDYWRGLIRWMQQTQNFWPLADDVEQRIVGYLAKNYGAVGFGRRPPLPKQLLPPDPPPGS